MSQHLNVRRRQQQHQPLRHRVALKFVPSFFLWNVVVVVLTILCRPFYGSSLLPTTLLSSSLSVSSRCNSICIIRFIGQTGRIRSTLPLLAATNNDDDDDDDATDVDVDDEKIMMDNQRWDNEETLLAMKLVPLPGNTVMECYNRVCQYTQSFPFAAVLPVQPLQYLPTMDGGVEITFLRKKTDIKSGVDGGIRFFITMTQGSDGDTNSVGDVGGGPSTKGGISAGVINILAKRNSSGQSISKIFAEKIAIVTYVRSLTEAAEVSRRRLTGDDDDDDGVRNDNSSTSSSSGGGSTIKIPQTRVVPPTTDVASVESLFHKWM